MKKCGGLKGNYRHGTAHFAFLSLSSKSRTDGSDRKRRDPLRDMWKKSGYNDVGSVYCIPEIEEPCPWCIKNGTAARKFAAEFQQIGRASCRERVEISGRVPAGGGIREGM